MGVGAGGSLRCFVGAFVVPEDAERLSAAALSAGSGCTAGRPVPQIDLHVTVKFLGDLRRSQLAHALEQTAALMGQPLTVRVPALVGLPGAAAARMLVGLVDDPGLLSVWRGRLDAAFGSDARPFLPHVTLQRWRRSRQVDRWDLDCPLEIRLRAPALYRSDRPREGARYRPVTGADLTGRSDG